MRHTNVRQHHRKTKKGLTRVHEHSRRVKDIMKKKGVYIPPAWVDIKEHKDKNYIVTGVDSKGKIQYIYNPNFILKQKKKKFQRINSMEKDNTLLRNIVKDLDKQDEAKVAYTMYVTGIRPGGRKTMADKKSFGVIDLKSSQAKIKNDNVNFQFPGKSGVNIDINVKDKKLSNIIKNKRGKLFNTSPQRVRSYLKQKGDYNIKDFRTLRAQKIARRNPIQAPQNVAQALGNTPKVAKDAYINPSLLK